MKAAVECISRAYGKNKGSSVKNVDVMNIIGYKVNGNGNARNVDSGPRCAAEQ